MDTKHYIENSTLTLQQIADKLGSSYKKVYKVWKTYPKSYRQVRKSNSYRRSQLGTNNTNYGVRLNTGPVSDNKGYLLIIKPVWYTGRKRSNHIFLHHKVICAAMGMTELPKGMCVHHCDEDPHNNEFNNLVLMTLGEHASLHASLASATTISKESTLKWVEARRAAKAAMI